MKTIINTVSALVAIIVCTASCQKDFNSQNKTADINAAATTAASLGLAAASPCDGFNYGDTIFYPEELPNDYILHTAVPLSGSFGAYPDGLNINALNGDIDITESETGLQYLIWYVPTGTKDTCKKFIIVSGINYTDSIYSLKGANPIAAPVYNATLGEPVACTTGCEFDDGPDDDDGDGFADEPPPGQEVIPQGVALDKSNGNINLRKSIQNGALGTNPLNGTFKDFILNYRISDGSSKTLNNIGFRMYYYKKRADIPKALLKELQAKKNLVLLNQQSSLANTFYSVSQNLNTAKNGAGEVKCRPPYIIVVQQ